MGRGNPDLPTFPSILKAFEKAALNPINHGYPPYGGKDSLKKAIISFYQQEYGASLTMDEITIFSGSLSALTALPMALVNPGEAVLTPNPSFFGYQTGIHIAGGKSISMDLKEENNYLPNLDDFTSENLEQAKLMFLNYPHNPTGAGASSDFFEDVVRFAKENNIIVAHDFAYVDINFNQKSPSFMQAKGSKDVGIEIYTLSKTFNMAGWRIAFAVGNKQVIHLLNQYIRSSVGGTFGAIQDAVAFGLENSKEERNQLRQTYAARRKLVLDKLTSANLDVLPSAGTFFLWVKLPNGLDDVTFANDLLQKEKVALVPGSTFGSSGQGYLRISLVSNINDLNEGINRLINYLIQTN